jgi:hypothetical protein
MSKLSMKQARYVGQPLHSQVRWKRWINKAYSQQRLLNDALLLSRGRQAAPLNDGVTVLGFIIDTYTLLMKW